MEASLKLTGEDFLLLSKHFSPVIQPEVMLGNAGFIINGDDRSYVMREIIRLRLINQRRLECFRVMKSWIILGVSILLIAVSGCRPERPRVAYGVPVAELEQSYGRLITVSNMPTPDQNGTGDRLGLFRDGGGTIWGIPLTIGENGSVIGCAPPALHEAPISDRLPANTAEVVGAANEPNGWRGGTGKLELLLRDAQGGLRWHAVEAVEIKTDPVCWSQSSPAQPLKHYRLVIESAGK